MLSKLLNRISSYIQLDLEYYIRNSLHLILAEGILIILGLVLSVTFAHLATRELYGQWNYIFAIIGILAIFAIPGMNTAITHSVATGNDKVFVTGTKYRFKWSVLGSLVILGVGVYYFFFDSVMIGKGLMIFSLFFPFYESFDSYDAFLTGKKRFNKVAKYRATIHIITVLITVLVIYISENLLLILAANLFSFSVLRGYFFGLTRQNMENQRTDSKAISFGKHLTIQNIPGVLAVHGDKIIIGLFLSLPELAIYSISVEFQKVLKSLLSPISALSFPKLADMKEREAYSAVKQRYPYLVIMVAIVAGITIALCPYIIPFLYTQKYTASVLYTQILLGALIVSVPGGMLSKALFPAQRKVRELYIIRIRPVVEMALLIVLTLYFGLLGAALARLLGSLFGTVYAMKLAKWF